MAIRKNKLVAPVVKWVGGKRQLLPSIEKYIPKKFDRYFEPFIGGGAVLFHLQPKKAVINDVNGELINLYKIIRDRSCALIEDLKKHRNEKDYFYEVRALDRDMQVYSRLSDVERASRIIFLNKTCFNGLFRVNNSGEFNAPFGKYKNPNIVNEVNIKAVSSYLSKNNVEIFNSDFEEVLASAGRGDFVYLDPPYDPVSSSANFTGYAKGGFDRSEQERLKAVCDALNKKGTKFLLSNSDTRFIKELYRDYEVIPVKAKRAINSRADSRGDVAELLIKN
ncbi:DNA adenine methylase [Oleidesulfovibrio alaskensis]|jgi:DNA adenine methylase|uniref:DNA adenine methylase n=1 Tax=Oleidesulfovibrio alaskensis TaxID=58180 RepID=UPI001B7F8B25|nr:DNA adenine methylase [Oleidesulfovibrio alaskensis]